MLGHFRRTVVPLGLRISSAMRFLSKLGVFAAAFTVAGAARAQQATFYLDRLNVPGAPDDTSVLFRPVTQPDNVFYFQMAAGFQYAPLRTSTLIQNSANLQKGAAANVIDTQLTIYGSAGFELFNRGIISLNFPWNPLQTGQSPAYSSSILNGNASGTSVVTANGPTADDLRLDIRGVAWRTPNLRGALGGGLSVFFPSGTSTAFGGDGSTTGLIHFDAEYDFRRIVLVFNTGIHFGRPRIQLNAPAAGN